MSAREFVETRFDEPGTLPPPGPIGRLVRLFLGVLCLWGVWLVFDARTAIAAATELPRSWTLWATLALVLWLLPPVVNIGFGVSWGAWPRRVAIGAIIAGMAMSQSFYDQPWSPALGWLVVAVMLYTLAHLGVSFVLAALLATPGCEMRSITHLWTIATGRETKEHYCPGFIDDIDRWERRWRAKAEVGAPPAPS